MRQIIGFVILTSAAALVACATPAPAPAPAAPAAAAVAASTPATVAAASAQPAQKAAIPYGYTRVVVNGEERFCRNDLLTGSRTEHQKVCLTAQQLEASQKSTQDFMDNVQQHGAASTFLTTPGASGGMGR